MFEKLKTLIATLYAMVYSKLPKFFQNRSGITGMVIALIVLLVTVGVVLPIGVLVTSNLSTALAVVSSKSVSTTQAENVTYDVFNNIWSAYNISVVVPLVAAAGLVISIIIAALAFRRSRG